MLHAGQAAAQLLQHIAAVHVAACVVHAVHGDQGLGFDLAEAVELAVEADGVIVIRVTDDGIGLPEARDAIAEPYMTTRQGGTGLGLAIVKKIVEQHYGELEFSDNPAGQGTCVTLTLHPDRLRPLAGKGGDGSMGQAESVPGRMRNRQDREDHGA